MSHPAAPRPSDVRQSYPKRQLSDVHVNHHRFQRRTFLATLSTAFAAPLLAAAEQRSRWPYERVSGVFAVHADFDVERYYPGLVALMSEMKPDLQKTLGITVRDEVVHLVLFAKQERFREYLQRHFPSVPYRQALFVRRRGMGSVFAFASNRLDIDLRHESTHALLNASLPYVPLWMDEGLAEYFEVEPANRQRREHAEHEMGFLRLLSGAPSIERLESINSLAEMGTREYREAWAIIHFLLHESPQSRRVLHEFLADLQAHNPPGQFSRRLQQALPGWKSRFTAYFRPRLALSLGE